MKGTVNRPLNGRQLPDVNSNIVKTYATNDTVEIIDSTYGDLYDGDDLWYQLVDGTYVWSGGVDTQADYTTLAPEDRAHYLISYRKVLPDARPDMNSSEVPDQLYFAPVRMPFDPGNVRLNTLLPEPFANGVMQAIRNLHDPEKKRNHVVIYIHGYQMLSSLKLDLLSGFALNYLRHPENKIAKVLFLTWPAQSLSRKYVDDRAIRAGEHFTKSGLFESLRVLSKRLTEEGMFLDLVVHSFGHQLLNGMVNPAPSLAEPVFENIFLMASDVTHLTVKKNGETLTNYFSTNGTNFHYEYAGLKKIGKNIHVFHNKSDYLLYSSTKRFVKDPLDILTTEKYRNLGNYGSSKIPAPFLEPGFHYYDVEQLVAMGKPGNPLDYPFHPPRSGPSRAIEKVWTLEDYTDINAFGIIFNIKRFGDHHRYLFTCKPVVDKVLEILT